MKTTNLTGRLLSYWASKAEIPSLTEQARLTLIRAGAYQPHCDLWQAGKLASTHKIGTMFADISQTWFAGRTEPYNPSTRVWVEGKDLCEAITIAFVVMKLGHEVDERLGLDLDERKPEIETIVSVELAEPDPTSPEKQRAAWPFPHFGKVSPE